MEPTLRDQPDLRSLLQALWRRKLIFFGILVTIPVVVYAISTLVPKTFEASTLMRVKALNVDPTVVANVSQVETEALLFGTEGVAKEAARELGLPPEAAGSLAGSVRIQPVSTSAGGTTELIQLTAEAEQARRAAEIANAYATAIDNVRSRRALRQIDQNEASLREQSADTNDVATEAELARQLQLLRGFRASVEEGTQAVTSATPPASPVSPHPRRNTALAALISLLLALGAVSVAERLDRRLRDSAELEPLLGSSLLSVIPRAAFPGAKPAPGPVKEAFATLAASLLYFNVDRPVTTVLVTSPTQGDGKTTVSVHLSAALARDGQDVILVDGDLRHPQVSVRLGIEPATGLAEVLSGRVDADQALVDVGVGEGEHGRFRVLAAGGRPPNPGRLLGSDQMVELLEKLEAAADIIVLDTAPILNVSDAVPLLERVSGIVLVAKIGATTRDALLRARQVVETTHGTVLGAVATGSAEAGLYGYGTEYYVAEAEAEIGTKAEPAAAIQVVPETVVEDTAAEEKEEEKEVLETVLSKSAVKASVGAGVEAAPDEDLAADEEEDEATEERREFLERKPKVPERKARRRVAGETVEWSSADLDEAIGRDRPRTGTAREGDESRSKRGLVIPRSTAPQGERSGPAPARPAPTRPGAAPTRPGKIPPADRPTAAPVRPGTTPPGARPGATPARPTPTPTGERPGAAPKRPANLSPGDRPRVTPIRPGTTPPRDRPAPARPAPRPPGERPAAAPTRPGNLPPADRPRVAPIRPGTTPGDRPAPPTGPAAQPKARSDTPNEKTAQDEETAAEPRDRPRLSRRERRRKKRGRKGRKAGR